MKRILVTGGSGFIGTNVVESYLASGHEVLSIDIKEPQKREHHKVFKRVDILDKRSLEGIFKDFVPTHVLHLAARADLHEKKNLEGYAVNIKGVENMVRAISAQPSVVRCIFTSTKLVCATDYVPKSMDDYCPNTLYGESKVMGEKIVKDNTTMRCDWCIVRPTSIWGPWSDSAHIPYGKFFRMIARGRYFHPGHADPPKSFGYVGNGMFQIEKLFDAPTEQIHRKIFYLTDYDTFTIREWADMISMKLRNKKIRAIPEWMVSILAVVGDLMKFCGIKEPLFSSFRLQNMRANTAKIPTEAIRQITGPLPYSMEQGVEETIAWFKKYGKNYIS
jgi:nucleoside-diphosphate-sugar epimerase